MNVAALFFFIALSPVSQDREFLRQAVASLRTETAQATAHYMDSNLPLRWYAHKIMRDYSRVETTLRDVGRAYGITLRDGASRPPAPRPFFANDALWMQTAIERQRLAIARFQQEARTTHDPRIRRRVNTLLPLLRDDLRFAEAISSGLLQRAVT